MEINYAIQWIEIYPVDSAIQRLNNRGQINRYPVDKCYPVDRDLSAG